MKITKGEIMKPRPSERINEIFLYEYEVNMTPIERLHSTILLENKFKAMLDYLDEQAESESK